MVNFFKSIVNAFAEFSFLPLPYYEDDGERYKYAFVPIMGLIITGISYLRFALCGYRHLNDAAVGIGVILFAAIISGGRHILGFVDYIDSRPTYKFRFKSWKDSRDRGVLRIVLVAALWLASMLITYDYLFSLLLAGFVFSRIYMGLLSSFFNEASNQSKVSIILLVLEFIIVAFHVAREFESLAICPLVISALFFVIYINRFRRSTAEALPLLEDDFVVSAETAWIFSVAMVSLVRSL